MADDPRDAEDTRNELGGNRADTGTGGDDLMRDDRSGDDPDEHVELHGDQNGDGGIPNEQLGSVHYGNQVNNPQGEDQRQFRQRNAGDQRAEETTQADATEKQIKAEAERVELENNIDTVGEGAETAGGSSGNDPVSLRSNDAGGADNPQPVSTPDTTIVPGAREGGGGRSGQILKLILRPGPHRHQRLLLRRLMSVRRLPPNWTRFWNSKPGTRCQKSPTHQAFLPRMLPVTKTVRSRLMSLPLFVTLMAAMKPFRSRFPACLMGRFYRPARITAMAHGH